jgi:hypothetical protein
LDACKPCEKRRKCQLAEEAKGWYTLAAFTSIRVKLYTLILAK